MADTNGNGKHLSNPFGGLSSVPRSSQGFTDPILLNQLRQSIENAMSTSRQWQRDLLDPRRSIEDECGYPDATASISSDTYRQLFDRDPIANRVVVCLPRESWQVTPRIFEDEDPETNTEFEQAIQDLGKTLSTAGGQSWFQDEEGSSFWSYLQRLDELSGIGHFGVMLLGLDDDEDLSTPLMEVLEQTSRMPDGPASEKEIKSLREPKPRQVLDPMGKPAEDGKIPTKNVTALPLTANEARIVDGWERERLFVLNAVEQAQQPTSDNPANLIRSDGSSILGTDAQYFQQQGYKSDAQYMGYRGGPSEQPKGQGWGDRDMPDSGNQGQQPGAGSGQKKRRRLLFLRVYDESLCQVVRYEWNIRNPRFGMPVMYRVTLNDPRMAHSGVGLPLATVFVHWTRVIHVADNLAASESFGIPRMQPVLNRLLDLRKVYGADGESAWRNACMKLFFETHPQLGGDVIINKTAMRSDLENMLNGQQQWMATSGMSVKAVPPALSDPTPHTAVQIEAICIQLAIPKRVFMGSERGELASSQDDSSWNDRLRARQRNHIGPRIIVPFIDRLIQIGVLPEPRNMVLPDEDAPLRPSRLAVGKPAAQGPEGAPGAPPGAGGPPGKQPFPPKAPGTPPFGGAAKPPGAVPPKAPPGPFGGGAKAPSPFSINAEPGSTFPFPGQGKPQPRQGGQLDGLLGEDEADDEAAVPVGEQPEGDEPIDPASYDPRVKAGQRDNARRGYSIEWPDLDSLTDKDKAAIFQQRVTAYCAAIAGDLQSMIPPKAIMTMLDGMDEAQAEAILQASDQQNMIEEEKNRALIEEQGFEPLPPEGFHDPDQPNPIAIGPGQSLHDPASGEEVGKSPFEPSQPVVAPVAAPQAPPGSPVPPGKAGKAGGPDQPQGPQGQAQGGQQLPMGALMMPGAGGKAPMGQGAVADFHAENPRAPGQMPPARNQESWQTVWADEDFEVLPVLSENLAWCEDVPAMNKFCPTGAGGGVDPTCGKDDHGGGHGGGHGEHGAHDHGAHEIEHSAHQAHTAHEVHEVHHGLHAGHGLEAGSIVAGMVMSKAIGGAAKLLQKSPKLAAVGKGIAAVHEAAGKAATAAVGKLEARYGKATAAAILGTGAMLAGTALPGVGKALPSRAKQLLGAVPLLVLAEAGHQLGILGPGSKVDKALGKVGGWIHAIKGAVGKGASAVGKGVGKAGKYVGGKVKSGLARAVGLLPTGLPVGNQELTRNIMPPHPDDDRVTLSKAELEEVARGLIEGFAEQVQEIMDEQGIDADSLEELLAGIDEAVDAEDDGEDADQPDAVENCGGEGGTPGPCPGMHAAVKDAGDAVDSRDHARIAASRRALEEQLGHLDDLDKAQLVELGKQLGVPPHRQNPRTRREAVEAVRLKATERLRAWDSIQV